MLAVPLVVVGGVGFFAATASVAAASRNAEPVAQSVTLVAIPDLRWSDVEHMPFLASVAKVSAVANLSVRDEATSTRCGDGLLELSAGRQVPGGVTSCAIDNDTFLRLAHDYRTARFRPRLGTLGDALSGVTVASDPAAAAVLATHEGLATVGRPVYQNVDVHVDEGLYQVGSGDRLAADRALDVRLRSLLRVTNSVAVVAGISDGATGPPHLHALIVDGSGMFHRLLTSPTTGRAGFVQLVDLTASVLRWSARPIPDDVDGRAIEVSDENAPSIATLADDDVHARAAADVGGATRNAIAVALLAVVALAVAGRSREARWAAVIVAPVPITTMLVQLVPWWRWGPVAYAALVVGLTVMLAAASKWRGALTIPALTASILAVDQLIGAPLQLSAPMGDNPLIAGRFHGMGNVAFGLFAASVLVLAAATHRLKWVVVLGVIAVAIDGLPMIGDDFGGVLALVPSLVLLGALVTGVPVTVRRVLAVAVGTAVVAFGVGVLDALRPESSRTHIGRFVAHLMHGHIDAVIGRKFGAMVGSFTDVVLDLLVAAVAVGAYLVRRRLPATYLALAVLALLGTVLNDSGVVVGAAVAMVAVPAGVEAAIGDTRPVVCGL